MNQTIRILLGAWLTGAVLGSGCFCGALATGFIVPKRGPSDDYLFVQAQIAEIQTTMEAMSTPMPEGYDEMAGLE